MQPLSEYGNELERENIKFRLNSGRAQYIRNGGKLGRKKGSVKTTEQKETQYKEVLNLSSQRVLCENNSQTNQCEYINSPTTKNRVFDILE